MGDTMISQGMSERAGEGLYCMMKTLEHYLYHNGNRHMYLLERGEQVCGNKPSNVNLDGFTTVQVIKGNPSFDKQAIY